MVNSFRLCFTDKKYGKICPTWEHNCTMEMFVLTLMPFHALTDAMCMEKTVGVCSLYPLLEHIKQQCEAPVAGDLITEELAKTAKQIRTQIWDYIIER